MLNASLIFGAVVCCVTAWLVHKITLLLRQRARNEESLQHFPQIKRHWLWGSVDILKYKRFNCDCMDNFLMPFVKEFKYCHAMWIGPARGVLVTYHPDVIKIILKRSDGKGAVYDFLKPWLGEGLITSRGGRWFRDRRLLTNAFHFDVLQPYLKIFNHCSQTFLEKIERHIARDESMDGFKNVSQLTLDSLFRCAFSIETTCQLIDSNEHPYLNAVRHLTGGIVQNAVLDRNPLFTIFPLLRRLTRTSRQFQYYCDKVHEQANAIIKRRRQELENDSKALEGKKYLDFIDIMLSAKDEDGKGLSNSEIRDEVDTFLFAGHDTTASAISWTLYCLATHPQYQEAVKEEVDSIIAGRETPEITWDDIPRLTFLSQCIKESTRLYSTVPIIQRRLEEDVEVHGHKLLAGTNIAVNLYALHHNPHIWEDPNKFNPERFSPENCLKRDPHAFIPFSAGPRNCIGKNFAQLEIKVLISRVIQRYMVSLEVPDEERPFQLTAVMESSKPLKFKFSSWD